MSAFLHLAMPTSHLDLCHLYHGGVLSAFYILERKPAILQPCSDAADSSSYTEETEHAEELLHTEHKCGDEEPTSDRRLATGMWQCMLLK